MCYEIAPKYILINGWRGKNSEKGTGSDGRPAPPGLDSACPREVQKGIVGSSPSPGDAFEKTFFYRGGCG
jgi:hypothetical protein